MEIFSALLAFCAGNSPITGEFSTQRPVMRSVDVCFDVRLNQQISKQWSGRDLRRHRTHYDAIVMPPSFIVWGVDVDDMGLCIRRTNHPYPHPHLTPATCLLTLSKNIHIPKNMCTVLLCIALWWLCYHYVFATDLGDIFTNILQSYFFVQGSKLNCPAPVK